MSTPPHLILTNATVVTMNAAFDVYAPGAVVVRDGAIAWVGPAAEATTDGRRPAAEGGQVATSAIDGRPSPQVIDCGRRILMPGLVNAHTHVPMSLLRGLADDLRLDVWLMGYMMPVEREFVSPDFCRLGALLSCAEMIRSGITSFADMYYFEEDVAKATVAAGMRALCGQTVLKFPSPDAPSWEDSLAMARDFIERWRGHPLIVPAVAPHAPYTCPPEILRACAQLAAETDSPLHIHISETALEVEDMRRENGMPVVPWVERHGLFEAKVLAAHCVHVDPGEMRTLRAARAGIAHCPSSNLKLASGVAPVTQMLNLGLNVGIGTDGPASNNDLDMFEETRLAAFLAKGTTGDPTALPARQALLMATRQGAQAMHIGHLTGSLEVGKRADLILVDPTATHDSPRFARDPYAVYSQLVYACKSTDVTDVMVNGQWLMRDRALLTLDEADLKLAAQDYARRVDRFLIQREQSVLNKLAAIGGLEQEESFEVQVKARITDPDRVLAIVRAGGDGTRPPLTVLRENHYHQYDTYFFFDDADQGRLRYREDEYLDDKGKVYNVRYRLTLTLPAKEAEFPRSILLSRSRFIAPAHHSRRFYREYFHPTSEREIDKDRWRWKVIYKDTDFFINLDRFKATTDGRPPTAGGSVAPVDGAGAYLELKSRTWSKRDAEQKAKLIAELLELFGVDAADTVKEEYVDMALG